MKLRQTAGTCSNPGFLLEPRKNYLSELQGNLIQKQYLQTVLKCLHLARIGRRDILLSVNKLARAVTKWTKAWPGRWVHQVMSLTGGGGPARIPNLRVCKHLLSMGRTRRRRKGELTSFRGSVQSAWQKPPVSRQGERTGLPASGRHVVRGRQSSPIPAHASRNRRQKGVRQGNWQGW